MYYERLDITKNPFETKWKILPINNYYSLSIPRTYTAVAFIKIHNCEEEEEDEDKPNEYFLFFGGVIMLLHKVLLLLLVKKNISR